MCIAPSARLPLQGVLLVMNGLAIVNNERFLEPSEWGPCWSSVSGLLATNGTALLCQAALVRSTHACPLLPPTHPTTDNWGFSQLGNNPMGPSPNALKYQVIGTLHAAAYMRGASSCFLLPCLALLVGSYRLPCECGVSFAATVGLAEAAGLLACSRRSSFRAAAVACTAHTCRRSLPLSLSSHCCRLSLRSLPAVPLIVINTLVILVKLLFG